MRLQTASFSDMSIIQFLLYISIPYFFQPITIWFLTFIFLMTKPTVNSATDTEMEVFRYKVLNDSHNIGQTTKISMEKAENTVK